MTWEPYLSPNPGESIAFVLRLTPVVNRLTPVVNRLTPVVNAYAVFHGPDGTWYSTVSVAGRRVTSHIKSQNEREAKARAVRQLEAFQQGLAEALSALEEVEAS